MQLSDVNAELRGSLFTRAMEARECGRLFGRGFMLVSAWATYSQPMAWVAADRVFPLFQLRIFADLMGMAVSSYNVDREALLLVLFDGGEQRLLWCDLNTDGTTAMLPSENPESSWTKADVRGSLNGS